MLSTYTCHVCAIYVNRNELYVMYSNTYITHYYVPFSDLFENRYLLLHLVYYLENIIYNYNINCIFKIKIMYYY